MPDYSLDKGLKYYDKHARGLNVFLWITRGRPREYAQMAVTKVGHWKCPYCMNPCGDHTAEELAACLRIERDRESCPTCGKLDENHLDDEYNACMRDRPELKKAAVSHVRQ